MRSVWRGRIARRRSRSRLPRKRGTSTRRFRRTAISRRLVERATIFTRRNVWWGVTPRSSSCSTKGMRNCGRAVVLRDSEVDSGGSPSWTRFELSWHARHCRCAWFPGADTCRGSWVQRLTLPQVRRYLTGMKTTVSSKGQIVLPAEFRQMDRVEPGQEFDVERVDRGDYRLVRRAAPLNEGAIAWLLACPQKDFFVPIDSESTDAL